MENTIDYSIVCGILEELNRPVSRTWELISGEIIAPQDGPPFRYIYRYRDGSKSLLLCTSGARIDLSILQNYIKGYQSQYPDDMPDPEIFQRGFDELVRMP